MTRGAVILVIGFFMCACTLGSLLRLLGAS